jgi:hypothetical protein
MLVGLGLQAGLRFNPVRYLNCSVHSDVLVEVPSPVQVGFNEDEFLVRDLFQAGSRHHIGSRSSRLLSSLAKERLGTEPCMFYESM